MKDNLKERLSDMSVLSASRTPKEALERIEILEELLKYKKEKIERLTLTINALIKDHTASYLAGYKDATKYKL